MPVVLKKDQIAELGGKYAAPAPDSTPQSVDLTPPSAPDHSAVLAKIAGACADTAEMCKQMCDSMGSDEPGNDDAMTKTMMGAVQQGITRQNALLAEMVRLMSRPPPTSITAEIVNRDSGGQIKRLEFHFKR